MLNEQQFRLGDIIGNPHVESAASPIKRSFERLHGKARTLLSRYLVFEEELRLLPVRRAVLQIPAFDIDAESQLPPCHSGYIQKTVDTRDFIDTCFQPDPAIDGCLAANFPTIK